jgi:DHA1 family bicyclomycin/chloramphenicol resistance-like MFS transporter
MLAILGLLVLALSGATWAKPPPAASASFAEQFAEYPSFSPPAASGATASPRPSPRAPSSPISAARPYVGSEVFGLSPGEVGLYFGAPALGYFFGNWLSGRYSVRVGINGMILWGTILSAGGLCVSLLLFLRWASRRRSSSSAS